MKRTLSLLLVLLAVAAPLRAESDDETTARKMALNLAGAFGNDGFKLRDGHWAGPIEKGKPVLVEVNLFSGNEYWFSAGASDKAHKLRVTVFDEAGRIVESDKRDPGFDAEGNITGEGQKAQFSTFAAGIAAKVSGRYIIRIEEAEGEPAAACLVYSYK
jgi:hypothetical protein